MPVVSAAGKMGPTLFVFKGKHLPNCKVLPDGKVWLEGLEDRLPRHTVVKSREKLGGADKLNFKEWAYEFIVHVRDLTSNGHQVLLIYDAYGSHMSLEVLQLFEDNGVVVYALPAHTSGKTQLLDVVLFSPFKRALDDCLTQTSTVGKLDVYNMFDFCCMLKFSFEKAFTDANIKAAFQKTGTWPIDKLNYFLALCLHETRTWTRF